MRFSMARRRTVLLLVALLALVLAFSTLRILPSVGAGANPPLDTDGDGCSDDEELGSDPRFGGRRDLVNPWDFFDTPPWDNSISVSDIFRVVQRFGSLDYAGAPTYELDFDRGPPVSGAGDPWDLNEPDGAVSVGDIVGVVVQFGHHCDQLPPPPSPPALTDPLPSVVQQAIGLKTYGDVGAWLAEQIGPINAQLYPDGEIGAFQADGDTLQPDAAAVQALDGQTLAGGAIICVAPDGSFVLAFPPTENGKVAGNALPC